MADTTTTKQAILYAAKSTVDEKGSNETQLADGRVLADGEGMEVVGEYADENASAYSGNRGDELARALDHAERISASLIVQHSDRLARGDGVKARHLVQLVLEAKARGIRLRSTEDDSSLESVLMAAAMGERNTEDSRRKGAAVSKGIARRRKAGKPVGGHSYGMGRRRDPETDMLEPVPDPETAPVVLRIYDEYLAGKSQQEILKRLNAEHIPAMKGGKWHPSTIRDLLQNPVYAGLVRDGDELKEGSFEAIVPRDRWMEAQRLRRAKSNTHRRGRAPLGQHLFRKGFLRCGRCGEVMVPRTERNKDGSLRETYTCTSRWLEFNGCGLSQQRRAPIDSAVYAYFEQVGLDVEATRDQLAAAVKHRVSEVTALLAASEREAAVAAEKVARVKDDYLSGDLTAAEWRELRAELEPAAEAAAGARDRLAAQLAEVEAGPSLAGLESELLSKLAQVKAAIAGEVNDADGVNAARAALMRVFDHFRLHVGQPEEGAHLELIGDGYWIEPVMSGEQVEGYDEKLRPVLTTEPPRAGEAIPNNPNGSGASPHAENNFRQSFPARNRVMAALAGMTVVVEAAARSGSLITADLAAELGRDLGAVPGPVTSRASAGPNELLAKGACVVRGAQDVLDAMLGAGARPAPRGGPALDAAGAIVVAAVEAGATTPDAVAAATGLSGAESAAALTRLELLGYLSASAVGTFTRTTLAAPPLG
jgi:DNA invertase Pin-like site-specific DNA recombinase